MIALMAAFSSTALFACDDVVDCPAILYQSSLRLSLMSEMWQDGSYHISIASSSGTCDFHFERTGQSFFENGADCNGTQLRVQSSQEDAERSTITLQVYQYVPDITVLVERDNVVLHDDEHRLSFRTTSHPHGRECGGPREAELTLML